MSKKKRRGGEPVSPNDLMGLSEEKMAIISIQNGWIVADKEGYSAYKSGKNGGEAEFAGTIDELVNIIRKRLTINKLVKK